jgi:hypothetical protein
LTLWADPGAVVSTFDPTQLNPNVVLPDFGAVTTSVPEPSSLTMVGFALACVAGFATWRSRKPAA